jgi:drug/metabolite transporter (DMT)-like permease
MDARLGELAALATSVLFTFTAVCFEFSAKRIGSLALNILRLATALAIFAVLGLVLRGEPLPLGAGSRTWFWLTLSGLVGFVFGDLFLFQSYIDIGARLSQVIYSSAPLITALIGFFALGERVSPLGLAGMLLVVAGIVVVIADGGPASEADRSRSAVPAARRLRGILAALLGALGQAGGFVLSKIGAPDYDPFAATQILVVAGLLGFILVAVLWRRAAEPVRALADGKAIGVLALGALFGPFLGVSLGLFAAQRANAGVAAALMSLPPIFILVPAILVQKERVKAREAAGAVMAVAGSALLFAV